MLSFKILLETQFTHRHKQIVLKKAEFVAKSKRNNTMLPQVP